MDDNTPLTDDQMQRLQHALVFGYTTGPAIEGLLVLDDPKGYGVQHRLTPAGQRFTELYIRYMEAVSPPPIKVYARAAGIAFLVVVACTLTAFLAAGASAGVGAVLFGFGSPALRGFYVGCLAAISGSFLSLMWVLRTALKEWEAWDRT